MSDIDYSIFFSFLFYFVVCFMANVQHFYSIPPFKVHFLEVIVFFDGADETISTQLEVLIKSI